MSNNNTENILMGVEGLRNGEWLLVSDLTGVETIGGSGVTVGLVETIFSFVWLVWNGERVVRVALLFMAPFWVSVGRTSSVSASIIAGFGEGEVLGLEHEASLEVWENCKENSQT